MLLAIETNSNNNIKNVAWIKSDVYNGWYYAFDILGSFLIVKKAKIIVDRKTAATIMQKNKGILLEIANKMPEEVFWPAMTKLLRTYITFAIDSTDFFLVFLKELVIPKNNSMHVFLNLRFDSPIFFS